VARALSDTACNTDLTDFTDSAGCAECTACPNHGVGFQLRTESNQSAGHGYRSRKWNARGDTVRFVNAIDRTHSVELCGDARIAPGSRDESSAQLSAVECGFIIRRESCSGYHIAGCRERHLESEFAAKFDIQSTGRHYGRELFVERCGLGESALRQPRFTKGSLHRSQ